MQLPQEFQSRMKQMLDDEYALFERALNENALFSGIRLNRTKHGAEAAVLGAVDALRPVPWCANGFYADKSKIDGKHPYHTAGLFYFQEPSAMAAVEALDIRKGDYILDLCAAPGGKATQAADKLAGTGLLVANEIDRKRAPILAENIERFGLANTLVTNETPERLAERFPSFFDKIIVDAPCSGEGMFRKEPQAIAQWSIEYTNICAARSRTIIDNAIHMLRPGGQLVYSTCTFAPCENEGIAEYILNAYPDMTLLPIPQLSMLSDGSGEYIGSLHDLSAAKRIFPHRQNGEGHFIALFQKKSAELTERKVQTNKPIKTDLASYRAFEKNTLTVSFDGQFILFGENLYRLPTGIDRVDGLKIVRAGLHMGICKKGRFEPSHALALALTPEAVRNTIRLPLGSNELTRYLRGETLAYDGNGWTLVTVDGFSLGWGKASGGILKNHFPKYLRRNQ